MIRKKLLKIKSNNFIIHLIQYLGVGGLAALTDWFVFYFLFVLGINYLISAIISFFLATGVNYFLSKYIFENSRYNINTEVILVYFVSVIGLLLNLSFMWFFYKKLGIFSLLSKIIATGLVFFWNFLSRKYWIFKD